MKIALGIVTTLDHSCGQKCPRLYISPLDLLKLSPVSWIFGIRYSGKRVWRRQRGENRVRAQALQPVWRLAPLPVPLRLKAEPYLEPKLSLWQLAYKLGLRRISSVHGPNT